MGNNRDRKFYHRKARPSYQRHHEEMQELALERIEDLFARAWQIRNSDPELANRYIMHIRKLSMATKSPNSINVKAKYLPPLQTIIDSRYKFALANSSSVALWNLCKCNVFKLR